MTLVVPVHINLIRPVRTIACRKARCYVASFAGMINPLLKWNNYSSANKESAYTYAIASAAIVYQIARACAADEIPGCACAKPTFEGRPASKNNKSSCSDNVDYAARFSKQFLDATELVRVNDKPKHRSRALMNLHNNALGRKVDFGNLLTSSVVVTFTLSSLFSSKKHVLLLLF